MARHLLQNTEIPSSSDLSRTERTEIFQIYRQCQILGGSHKIKGDSGALTSDDELQWSNLR